MNMEQSISNNDPQQQQQLPSSPKKRLHAKEKGTTLADTISTARESLKNGRDISARNLLMDCGGGGGGGEKGGRKPLSRNPSLEFDPKIVDETSESSVEEIVAIEEDNTDFVSGHDVDDDSEDEETVIEEVVEEYYEEEYVEEYDNTEEEDDDDDDGTVDSELEPLPPPIVIPKALRVKEKDEEETDDDDDDDDSDDDTDGGESIEVKKDNTVNGNTISHQTPVVVQAKKAQPTSKHLPTTKTITSNVVTTEMNKTKLSTPSSRMQDKDVVNVPPKVNPPAQTVPAPKVTNNEGNHVQATKTVATMPVETIKSSKEEGEKLSTRINESDGETKGENGTNTGVAWEKPNWTKDNRLKATGISPAKNLAKPITQQQFQSNPKDTVITEPKTPRTSNTKLSNAAGPNGGSMKFPKSPQSSNTDNNSAPIHASKSAPQPEGGRKKYVPPPPVVNEGVEEEDEFATKIAWVKPEWAQKKVLRTTSKTDKILSGGKLERSIGGIRPIDDPTK
jgi:hypothetical protein